MQNRIANYQEKLREFREMFPERGIDESYLSAFSAQLRNSKWYSDLSNLEVEVNILPEGVDLSSPMKVEPMVLLTEAGIALTPAISPEDSRAAFAVFRYGWYFREVGAHAPLYLPEECRDIETRMKTLLSEDLAVGFACHILRDSLELRHIADTKSAIRGGFVTYVGEGRKSPDFCGLSDGGVLSFAESKGTMVSILALNDRIKSAREQIADVTPLGLPPGKNYILASYIATVGNSEEEKPTTIRVICDVNEGNDDSLNPEAEDRVVRASYAKVLRYAGRDDLATSLLEGQNWMPLSLMNRVPQSPFLPIGFTPFGDCVLLSYGVFMTLAFSDGRKIVSRDLDYGLPQPEKIYLSNGVAVLKPPV